jgi:hypothetical protein
MSWKYHRLLRSRCQISGPQGNHGYCNIVDGDFLVPLHQFNQLKLSTRFQLLGGVLSEHYVWRTVRLYSW